MKQSLRKLFWPLLRPFEEGDSPGSGYKASHRTILKVVGALFLMLAALSGAGLAYTGQWGALIPALVFLGAGGLCLIVGALGSDAAVARIWRNR